jgi:acyl-CoA thioester hydrolase
MTVDYQHSDAHVYLTRVRAHQTDLNGAMYHGAFLDIFDDARIETFRQLGYTYERLARGGWNAIIRRVDCEFYAPARMDDLLAVNVHVEKMSSATMTLRYECRRDTQLLALAHAVFAFLDRQGKPTRVPADLRQVVLDHETLRSAAT